MSKPDDSPLLILGADPIARLTQLWRKGRRPDIREFLDRAGELQPEQVVALLCVDQWQRWHAGERVPAETYLDRYPEVLHADLEAAFDIIYGEFLVREELGEAPTLGEYGSRFPEFVPHLRRQVEVHRTLQESEPLEPGDRDRTRPPAPLGERPVRPGEPAPELPCVTGYEILGELGRGGMGVVYKARQVRLDRLVALKMILAGDHAGPEHLARFKGEAEALAQVPHPNIVQIYEVGEQDRRPFVALEYVEGQSLAQKFAGTPLPPREAAHLVETLARAIHAAHRRGVIHRDLKPANVLITADGTLKVTDFGLAKRLGDASGMTRSGAIVGTPSYMAPEQAGGHSEMVGPAADVYALGAILYDLLTGRPPFQAESPFDAVLLVLHEEPVSPSRWRPKLPRDIETICLKCLQKAPADRYADAEALADDLRRFLAGRPIAARRVGPLGHVWSWCRRKPTLAALTASVSALLLVVAAGSTLAALRLRDDLWNSYTLQARASRSSDRPGRRFDALDAVAKAARIRPSQELREEAIAAMALADIRLIRRWEATAPGVAVTGAAFDAGLQRYAYGDSDGNIHIRRLADHHELLRLSNPGRPAWVLQFSPDGRYLAARFHSPRQEGFAAEFCVWETGLGRAVFTQPPGQGARAWDFSLDSRRIAIGQPDGAIEFRELDSGALSRRLRAGPTPYAIAFHPDGHHLATSSLQPPEARVHDLDTGSTIRLPHPSSVRGLAWHPDGRLLATACHDHNVYVWDTQKVGRRTILQGHQSETRSVAFNHAGDLLASTAWDDTVRLWDPWSGRQRVVCPAAGWPPQFSPDDERLGLVLDNHSVGIWQVDAGRERRTLRGYERAFDSFPCVDISPDGRLLVSVGFNDGIRLWDLSTAAEVARLPLFACEMARFQPDGKGLITGSRSGIQVWPIGPELAAAGKDPGVRVGPPRPIRSPQGLSPSLGQVSRDGRILAFADTNRQVVVILPLDGPEEPVLLENQPEIGDLALSPDGRWVALGTWHGSVGIRVWDVRARKLAKVLAGGDARVAFSPDGRWLLAGTADEYGFWEVGTWRRGWAKPREHAATVGPMTFTPDGRMLAFAPTNRLVRLVDPVTGQDLADLTSPDLEPIIAMCLSPDGGRLVIACTRQLTQLWDLRQVRRRLADLGLDWKTPTPRPTTAGGERPLSVRLVVESRQ